MTQSEIPNFPVFLLKPMPLGVRLVFDSCYMNRSRFKNARAPTDLSHTKGEWINPNKTSGVIPVSAESK